MADIDLKTETPDASINDSAVLFGADSQASASPSVYAVSTLRGHIVSTANTFTATQTITPAVNTNALAATGYSLTGSASASFMDLAGTWNTSGTPTAIKLNITDTTSNAASLLMDLQVGGATRFNVTKAGGVNIRSIDPTLRLGYLSENQIVMNQGVLFVASTSQLGFSSSSTGVTTANGDVILTRRGTANLRLGAADTTGATAPTPQFLSAQSWASSTTNNQTGANFTIDGSQGTGTGAGGSIIFRVAPAGGVANGVQNALATALTINSAGLVSVTPASGSATSFQALRGSISTPAYSYSTDSNSGTFFGAYNGLNCQQISVGGNLQWIVGQSETGTAQIGPVAWAAKSGTSMAATDLYLYRDDANKLALRNGAAAQTFRIYGTTDGTNSEYLQCFYDTLNSRFEINMTKTGSASNRPVVYRGPTGAGSMTCNTGTNIWSIGQDSVGVFWNLTSAGHLLAQTDNLYDIGASGATRPRRMFAAGYITAPEVLTGNIKTAGGSGGLEFNSTTLATLTQTTFAIGGTTSSFPAIKRSTTFLQARLADDSAFAGFASANMQAATAYIVATLPGTPGTGMIARVTDASSPTIGTAVAGSGAAYALVNYNGANWTVIGV